MTNRKQCPRKSFGKLSSHNLGNSAAQIQADFVHGVFATDFVPGVFSSHVFCKKTALRGSRQILHMVFSQKTPKARLDYFLTIILFSENTLCKFIS